MEDPMKALRKAYKAAQQAYQFDAGSGSYSYAAMAQVGIAMDAVERSNEYPPDYELWFRKP